MCSVWKHPTDPAEEVGLETLSKIPSGIAHLNITGGEPTLRKDLIEIVALLHPRASVLEISTNGMHPRKLEEIVSRFPDVKIRLSVEGRDEVNDEIRGEPEGYQKKMSLLQRLRDLGGTDLGIATVIQDQNVDEVLPLFRWAVATDFEFSTSALHNGFQFHRWQNEFENERLISTALLDLICSQLRSKSVKSWFRAYMNVGLLSRVLGYERPHQCTAGSEFCFIDSWGDMYACNVRPDLLLGSLVEDSWDSLMRSDRADRVRDKVEKCPQNCWMVTSARTSMRSRWIHRLPKWRVLWWVLLNKLRAHIHRPIDWKSLMKGTLSSRASDSEKRLQKADFESRRLLTRAEGYSRLREILNR